MGMANSLLAITILAVALPVDAGVPKSCSAMPECKGLQGDCCPNSAGVQLDCCILAGVRIAAEESEDLAKKSQAAADAAEKAAKAAEAKAESKGGGREGCKG